MNTMNDILEKAMQNGYLALTQEVCDAYPEVVEQVRYTWRANRLELRLPYIEIHPRPEKQALLVYDVGHVAEMSRPALRLIKDLQRQIAAIQREAGAEVQCHIQQTESHRAVIGELPMSNALEVAAAITAMAPQPPRVA